MTRRSSFVALVGATLMVVGSACSSATVERPSAAASSAACEGTTRARTHDALLQRQEITAVAPLKGKPFVARPTALKVAAAESRAKLQGARVVLRPGAGLTAEWLQLVASCDRSRGEEAAPSPSTPLCPFELEGSSTTVMSTGDGFALDVVSDDPRVASEILRRARLLAAGTN